MSGIEELMATKVIGDLTLGTALTIGGLAVSAGGAIVGGMQQSKMANYNAQVAENQAQASRNQASILERQQRRRQVLLESSQTAATAGSGVTPEGSPLLVMSDGAAEAEYDAQLIRYGGEVNAAQAYSQAALDRMQARSAEIGSYFGAISPLLLAGGALKTPSSSKTILGSTGKGDTFGDVSDYSGPSVAT